MVVEHRPHLEKVPIAAAFWMWVVAMWNALNAMKAGWPRCGLGAKMVHTSLPFSCGTVKDGVFGLKQS